MLELLWIALAGASVAVTVTKTLLFEELRSLIEVVVMEAPYPVHKLAILVRCPYCAAHWVVAGLWMLYWPRVPHPVLMYLATVAVATAVAALLSRAYNFAGAR